MNTAPPTNHEQFYALYLSRVHTTTGGASTYEVADSPAAQRIRRWPLAILAQTAPDSLPHTITGLNAVLWRWDEHLGATRLAPSPQQATTDRSMRPRTRGVPVGVHVSVRRHFGALPRPATGHSLSYWNCSPNGGLRRWG